VFSGFQLGVAVDDLPKTLRADPATFKNPAGNRRVEFQSVVVAKPSCVVATVVSDFSAVVITTVPKDPALVGLVALVPATPAIRAGGINPTPWTIDMAWLITRTESPQAEAPCW